MGVLQQQQGRGVTAAFPRQRAARRKPATGNIRQGAQPRHLLRQGIQPASRSMDFWRRQQQALGIWMQRLVQHHLRRAMFDHRTGIQHGNFVAHLGGQPQIMGDEQHRGVVQLLQFAHHADDAGLNGHIQRRRRFIGHHQRRLAGKRHGDQHPLAHAAGQLMRVTAQQPGRVRQMHAVQGGNRRLPPIRHADAPQMFAELAADGAHRVKRRQRLLRDEGNLPAEQRPPVAGRHGQQIPPGELQPAPADGKAGRQHLRDGPTDHGLAGTAFAHQPEHLARRQRQVEVAQRRHRQRADAGGDVQPLGAQQRHPRPSSSRTSRLRRKPSPSRLKPATVTKIASTGASRLNGA